MHISSPIKIALLGASAGLAILLGFFAFETSDAVLIVRHGGYWFLLAAFLLWLRSLFCVGRSIDWAGVFPRSLIGPGVMIGGVSILLLLSQPMEFKVVMDELVLAGTSLQMHLEKEAMAVMRAYEIEGVFHSLGGMVDKRPLAFPFLVSVLHDLTGYRALQGVVLNALLTPIFLGLNFWLGSRIWRQWGGYLAAGLWATVPLLPMVATSGGFDLLNLVLLLVTAIAAYFFLREPKPDRLNLMVLTSVLLAQTRYESVLFIMPVAVCVLIGWWRQRKVLITGSLIVTPILLMIYPLQRRIMNEYEGFWQLPEPGVTPFSASFVSENLGHAANYFFAWGIEQPNSFLLSALFLCAGVVVIISVCRRSWRIDLPIGAGIGVCFLFATVVVLNFSLLMAYHWGQIDDIMATRLVLPVILFQVVLVVKACSLLPNSRVVGLTGVCLVGVFYLGVTRPTCARTNFLPWGITQQQIKWTSEKVESLRSEGVLVVSDVYLAAIIEKVSAILIETAVEDKARIELHQRLHTFNEIIVFSLLPTKVADTEQHPRLAKAKLHREKLEAAFELEVIEREKLNAAAYIEMARIRSVRLEKDERMELKTGDVEVDYIGKMRFGEPEMIREFVKSLPD